VLELLETRALLAIELCDERTGAKQMHDG
jgi:hypothetical protein